MAGASVCPAKALKPLWVGLTEGLLATHVFEYFAHCLARLSNWALEIFCTASVYGRNRRDAKKAHLWRDVKRRPVPRVGHVGLVREQVVGQTKVAHLVVGQVGGGTGCESCYGKVGGTVHGRTAGDGG